jgi:uncharacterized membrane protein (DUF4010 family)
MDHNYNIILDLLAALAIGLLIGIEREWNDRDEKEVSRPAGIRTFSLISIMGGVWAVVAQEYGAWIIMAAFLAVTALVIVTYLADVKEKQGTGSTTSFAMMLTFVLSALAVMQDQAIALAIAVVVVTLLGYKRLIHKSIRKIEEREIYAGIKLLVISVVLLPNLPDEGYGPYDALNPYWIWLMVVLICTLSFIGYFTIKYSDYRKGALLTSLIGGLASSTAVTISLAQLAKKVKVKQLFIAGVLFASCIMFIRVMVEVSVVNAALLNPLWIPLTVMFLGLLIGGIWLYYLDGKKNGDTDQTPKLKNPFQLAMAVKFGLLLAIILVLSEAVKDWFGEGGIYILSVVSGLLNVDAITLSLSKLAEGNTGPKIATMGIVLATATNTLVKAFIFAFYIGIKASLRLFIYLLAAVIPGLVVAVWLLY